MFKNLIFSTMVLGFTNAALARGGAIGGGEVVLTPLLTCHAQGIDPTFSSQVTRLIVAAETSYDGQILEFMEVKVLLQDAQGTVLRYLQTQQLPGQLNLAKLNIHRAAQVLPGEENPVIGTLRIQGTSGFLNLRSVDPEFDELSLSHCAHVADPQ